MRKSRMDIVETTILGHGRSFYVGKRHQVEYYGMSILSTGETIYNTTCTCNKFNKETGRQECSHINAVIQHIS